MGKHLQDPLLLAWLGLCAATVLSLVIGGSGGAAVLAITFTKAGVVMFVFMELRAAPILLRLMAAGWLTAVLGALMAIHAGWFG